MKTIHEKLTQLQIGKIPKDLGLARQTQVLVSLCLEPRGKSTTVSTIGSLSEVRPFQQKSL